MQRYVTQKAEVQLTQLLGGEVRINSFSYAPLREIKFSDIVLLDPQGKKVASLDALYCKFEVGPLFRKQLVINVLTLNGLYFNLETDAEGRTNLQYIIDNLGEMEPVNLDFVFDLDFIKFNDCTVQIDRSDIATRRKEFDPNHLKFEHISCEITGNYHIDSAAIACTGLTFVEQSGWKVKKADFEAQMTPKSLELNKLDLQMRQSIVSLRDVSVGFDTIADLAAWERIKDHCTFNFDLRQAELYGKDLAPFWKNLYQLEGPVKLSVQASGSYNDMRLNNLSLRYGQKLRISTNASIYGLNDPSEAFLMGDFANISCSKNELEVLATTIAGKSIKMPDPIRNMGNISFRGNISGFFSDLVAYGTLTTDVGIIKTDLFISTNESFDHVNFSGKVGTNQLDLNKLLGKETELEDLSMSLAVKGGKSENKPLVGSLTGTINSLVFKNYNYQNITIDATYDEVDLDAGLTFHDENGSIILATQLSFEEDRTVCHLQTAIDSFRPNPMHLTEKYADLAISVDALADFVIYNPDSIEGYLSVDSLILANSEKVYTLSFFDLTMESGSNGVDLINIESDLINGKLTGEYAFSTLAINMEALLAEKLPALRLLKNEPVSPANNFLVDLTINPVTDLFEVLDSPIRLEDTTTVTAYVSDYNKLVEVNVNSGFINLGRSNLGQRSLDSLRIHVNNYNDTLRLAADTYFETFLDTTLLMVRGKLNNDELDFGFGFNNAIGEHFSGMIDTHTTFRPHPDENKHINLECEIKPSTIVLSDSLWNIRQGNIKYDEDHLYVKNVAFENSDQYLRVGGKAEKDNEKEIILVGLRNINLQYLSEVLYMPDVKLTGLVSGRVALGHVLNKPIMNATVSAKNFGLNTYAFGDIVEAKAQYNYDTQQIELTGLVTNEYADTSKVTGFVSPARNEMLLDCDLNNLSLEFIKPYIATFASDFTGIAHGKLYVGGDLDKVEIWGDAFVRKGSLGIDFLKTTFFFEDSVHLRKQAMIFKDIHIHDQYGHTGKVDALVTHKYFDDFKFDIGFEVNDMLVFDANEIESPDFYGHILVDGKAKITGDVNKMDIFVTGTPKKGSTFSVPVNSYTAATDNTFITFVNREKEKDKSPEERRKRRLIEMPEAKVNVSLDIDVTPDAEVQIIFDNRTNDVIRANGEGNLKVDVDQNGNVKLYGNFDITKGEYNFSMQGAMRKKFEVGENSSISFDGDPMSGIMDINATYQTSASLVDLLDEAMLSDITNKTVKVLCIANITGPLQEPTIKFDIQLPYADEEVQRRVLSAINTEEMMSQQMVFLLLTGKFYNPEVTKNTSSYSTELAASFATATLSSQLNYWLSQISNNVNLGLNYRQDSEAYDVNRSFEVNISTNFLDNRLLINSNLGYRQQYGSEDFIGDFDIEYKLTPNGRLRLKAYNQTNDKLYSTALYTQGLGIMYKEDFDTWKNLFADYKESLRKRTPEENAVRQEKKQKEKAQKAKDKEARAQLRADRRKRHKEFVAAEKKRKAEEREAKRQKTSD
ncbi:MAG: translocation/assembly module TamB domain-containing protein [Paludibacteraceae bacterium]|nr:translocation/assembly module TamB domain-containing protein [Paludibacteraceae bacterium]